MKVFIIQYLNYNKSVTEKVQYYQFESGSNLILQMLDFSSGSNEELLISISYHRNVG